MELFHKIYSCYYNVVRHILDEAGHSPITRQDMEDICRAYGFQESALSIIPKLTDSTWALLEEQDKHTFTSRLGHAVPALPLTNLQKAWLKSLIQDPRFQLFFTDRQLELLAGEWDGLPSLYHEDDFYYYDRYRDGDSYDSPSYRKHFQAILKAIREERVLLVAMRENTAVSTPLRPRLTSFSIPPRMTSSGSAVSSSTGIRSAAAPYLIWHA